MLDKALEQAIVAAKKSSGAFRHGAAVYCGNTVISTGNNYPIDHPRLYSMHAEMDALSKIPRRLKHKKLHVVVVRLSSDGGGLRLSFPCRVCQKMLEKYNISTIYFSS